MGELVSKSVPDVDVPIFLFTVIIPVYNTEEYLEEAIQSVIAQDIGFEENIQLILVNNATEDKSGEICERYRETYPNNVTYIVLSENAGPNGARNAGIPYIKGVYVNFLDSDDKWAENGFSSALSFFSQHEDEIDCVACRIHNFGSEDNWHPLDYVFSRSRVIDIEYEYDCPQTHLSSVFLTANAVFENHMDTEIVRTEDTKYILQVILAKKRFGVLRETVYWYRRHPGSTMNAMEKRKLFYFDVVRQYYWYFINQSQAQGCKLSRYVQFMLMYDIQWRLKIPVWDGLTQDELKEYQKSISDILAYIDDDIICSQRNIWKEHKIFALNLKYKRDIREEWQLRKGSFYFHNIKLYDLRDKANLEIKILKSEHDTLILEGEMNYPLISGTYYIYAENNLGQQFKADLFDLDEGRRKKALGIEYHQFKGFSIRIPLEDTSWIRLGVQYGNFSFVQTLRFGWLVPLSDGIPWSHHEMGGVIVRVWKRKNKLIIKRNTLHERLKSEWRYLLQLIKGKHRRMFLFRIFTAPLQALKRMSKKKIWLFTDRIATADDNGEFLLDYACSQDNPNIRSYYVISKNSPDYLRIKKKFRVVPYKSLKFYVLFMLSDVIISSIFDMYFYRSFGIHHNFIKDRFHYKAVYLQHCVLIDDLSKLQNKLRENMSLFITTVRAEYNAMFQYPYDYDASAVKLTGMPRYDVLEEARSVERGRNVLFAPTYRMYLNRSDGINTKTGKWEYSEKYKKSEYFKFYNGLINDPRILACMRKHGYTGTFRLHPAAMSQACDFVGNDVIQIHTGATDFRSQFKENCFVITDYSTTAVDYAYVGTPVVYAQFDVDTFYINHTYMPGFFNYEKDGFGPVCYDYESTVEAIINVIERDCTVEEVYRKRRDAFFTFNDHDNCKRVYEEILKLDEE